jgi:hypothetical protein
MISIDAAVHSEQVQVIKWDFKLGSVKKCIFD